MSHEVESGTRPMAGLLGLLVVLRRRFYVLLICAVVVPGAAVAWALHQPKIYTAKASLLFRSPQFDQQLLGTTPFLQTSDPAVEQATNIQLVELPVVAADTAAELHGRLSAAQVASDVSVISNGLSNVGTISASTTDPQLAALLATTYAQRFSTFSRDTDRAEINSAIVLIQGETAALPPNKHRAAQRQTLQRYVRQLQIMAALQTGNAEVVQTAQPPTSPSSPRPVRDGGLGLVIGVLLGIGLVLLLERLDRERASIRPSSRRDAA